jgi:hypothetical protein
VNQPQIDVAATMRPLPSVTPPSFESTMEPGTYVLATATVRNGRLRFATRHGSMGVEARCVEGWQRPGRMTNAQGVQVLHIRSENVAQRCAVISGNTPFGPLSRSRDHVLYRCDGQPSMKDADLEMHFGIGDQYTNHWVVIEVEQPTAISLTGSVLNIGDTTFDLNSGYAYELRDGTILRNDHPAHALLGLDSPSDSSELDGEGCWSLFDVDQDARDAIAAMDDATSRSLLKSIEQHDAHGRNRPMMFNHWVDGQRYTLGGIKTAEGAIH